MKSAIASTYIYNIILVFIVITFALIMGTITYYKAFKVNKSILAIIEKYEGYNSFSQNEIDVQLKSIGYNVLNENNSCPAKSGTMPESSNNSVYRYCVYYYDEGEYYSYGVTTYISLDFPMFDIFLRIPVYSKSNIIYNFS